MTEFYQKHKPRIDRAAFFVLITVVVYASFRLLFTYIAPFFFGLVIALLMEPAVRFIVKKTRWRRWVVSLICLLLFIGLISSLGAWLVATLWQQVRAFLDSAPQHIGALGARVNELNLQIQGMSHLLPEDLYLPNIEEILLSLVTTFFGGGAFDQGMRFATGIPNFFINTIVTLVSAHLIIADRENIFNAVKRSSPKWISSQMRQTKKGISRAMGGYFRAQYILMLVIGIISIVGLLILGNPYALLLGILLAALDFLPIVGTGAVLVPWALISVMMGDIRQAVILAIIYGVITITRQVLQPKILGDQMGAHPLASLISIFIGFRIFGLLGLVIGPSLLMIFIAIYETNQGNTKEV